MGFSNDLAFWAHTLLQPRHKIRMQLGYNIGSQGSYNMQLSVDGNVVKIQSTANAGIQRKNMDILTRYGGNIVNDAASSPQLFMLETTLRQYSVSLVCYPGLFHGYQPHKLHILNGNSLKF